MMVCRAADVLSINGDALESDSTVETASEPRETPPEPRQNALKAFEEIRNQVSQRHLAVFLDYDGTLTPIVDNPDEAKISHQVKNAVEDISMKYPTAIITGRSIKAITQFVKLESVYYAGSHGYDIRSPGGEDVIRQVGQEYLPVLAKARDSLRQKLKKIPGSMVEDNKYSVSAHYRRVAKEHWAELESIVDNEVSLANGKLKKGNGKMVFELRANMDWHKGKAVRTLIKVLESSHQSVRNCKNERTPVWRSQMKSRASRKRHSSSSSSPQTHSKLKKAVFAIYIGDDKTDEDAFVELAESKQGLGIRVLSKGSSQNQSTSAQYVLNSVEEVRQFLDMLSRDSPHLFRRTRS
mmetsp:Transcript_24859/g.59783  ORF Transcript_24859/g.59783 Transcript_24859/m.59783 type:complete len:352 (-) Transcript_24859:88-1143(-)